MTREPLWGNPGGRNVAAPPNCSSLPSRDAARRETTASVVDSSRTLPENTEEGLTVASLTTVGRTSGTYPTLDGRSHRSMALNRQVVPKDSTDVVQRIGQTSADEGVRELWEDMTWGGGGGERIVEMHQARK
jgi:hypothetical protein